MMTILFAQAAEDELYEAVVWYDTQRDGLETEFLLEVRKSLERIAHLPEAWERFSPTTRCCRTRRFPYGIAYRVQGDEVLIVAVMHLHRDPRRWDQRLEQ